MDDAERKVRLVEALPWDLRELLMNIAGDLVDLKPEALEFVGDVVSACLVDRGQDFDPMPLAAAACARYRARRRKN